MDRPRIVIDTNVWVSALRSKQGASWALVSELPSEAFETCVSTSLVLEHEEVFMRQREVTDLTSDEIEELLDFICELSIRRENIFFLWRTAVADPDDAHVFELAVAAQVDYLVTFNKSDFPRAGSFGIMLTTPHEFLSKMGLLS